MGKPWIWFGAAMVFALAVRTYLGIAYDWIEVAQRWPGRTGLGDFEIRAIQAGLAAVLSAVCAVLAAAIGVLRWRVLAR